MDHLSSQCHGIQVPTGEGGGGVGWGLSGKRGSVLRCSDLGFWQLGLGTLGIVRVARVRSVPGGLGAGAGGVRA